MNKYGKVFGSWKNGSDIYKDKNGFFIIDYSPQNNLEFKNYIKSLKKYINKESNKKSKSKTKLKNIKKSKTKKKNIKRNKKYTKRKNRL